MSKLAQTSHQARRKRSCCAPCASFFDRGWLLALNPRGVGGAMMQELRVRRCPGSAPRGAVAGSTTLQPLSVPGPPVGGGGRSSGCLGLISTARAHLREGRHDLGQPVRHQSKCLNPVSPHATPLHANRNHVQNTSPRRHHSFGLHNHHTVRGETPSTSFAWKILRAKS